ncbi:hypothetical protein GKJPGBOP_00057 [Streptomyces paromomycinus]|uniref:Uncharacterized protein n=2 Tax=Streptomyces paromomycinus TaxID=92743 RepID=A0A401VTJ0_STREY|nr:hypothetical protein GKJPGBOP_00057 [Streptomyces paromomycinus]
MSGMDQEGSGPVRRSPTHTAVRRTWTVELRPQPSGPVLDCPSCMPRTRPLLAESARSAALHHLAQHAREDALPLHLRTCQCQTRGCRWHPPHRGCTGPVLLVLARDCGGRRWRLADTCAACAAVTPQAAAVPDTLLAHPVAPTAPRRPAPDRPGPGERERVRQMLTYLAAALPRFCSPTARLLALQCALRADRHGRARLPSGLLRGMRLGGNAVPWHELTHAGWLRPMASAEHNRPGMTAQLLDSAVLAQAPTRSDRARAAHWALHPAPLTIAHGMPPAVHLAALALAAHTALRTGSAETEQLTRLIGLPLTQVEDLLDRLILTRVLDSWHHDVRNESLRWYLPLFTAWTRHLTPPGI